MGAAIEIIPIHFDVPGHEIPLSTFVSTSEQTHAIVRALNDELFDGQLQFQLFVLPPAEGSFLTRLGIVLVAGWGVVWTFTESDIGQAFIKGLTGHEPAHWAESAGVTAREILDGNEQQSDGGRQFASIIVCESTRSFLATTNRELERAGVGLSRFRDAYEAKNTFYDSCAETPEVRALGFDQRPIFPINRDEFPQHQSILPPKEEDPDEQWFVATAQLRVTSPNWDREDRMRQWKGRDHQGRDRYFRIEDEEFWRRVALDAINTHIIDSIKVQWAYQGRPDQPRNCRVLRVLEFNETKLASPLPDDALVARLGQLGEITNDQGDLFAPEAG